jgi:ABC-type branched-subunit amino acid transport system ATPase component
VTVIPEELDPAELAASVLDEEARRHSEQEARSRVPDAGEQALLAAVDRAPPPLGQLLGWPIGPLLGALAASVAGGSSGWRWALVVLSVPAGALASSGFMLRAPGVPVPAALARLRKVRTLTYLLGGFAALGLILVTTPVYVQRVLGDHRHLSAAGQGAVGGAAAAGGLAGIIVAVRLAHEDLARLARITAFVVAALAITVPVSVSMPDPVSYAAVAAVTQALVVAGLVLGMVIAAAVVPVRLRSVGVARAVWYLSLYGGLGGALLVAGLGDRIGDRPAVALVAAAAATAGGTAIALAGRWVRRDLAAEAAELIDERDELQRLSDGADAPLLQVHHLDFSYGQVQVLFDVSIDVYPGEVLAILGTNGAGKSTLLRVISGLAQPDRGVLRLGHRTITFSDPAARVGLGIVQVAGGKAVFGPLSVRENLVAGAYRYKWERQRIRTRTAEVVELFPRLGERLDQPAGTLSGGEQQMLAIAKALMLDPRILIVDELSLGLAPVVIQELLGVIERLKGEGMTMVIVEQSVNVALALADRAIFMEKGQVRFTGRAAELMERDDLVRAVFLGGEH